MQAVPKALPQTADKLAGNGGFVSILYHRHSELVK